MNPQMAAKCLMETVGALAVYKSVQLGMKSWDTKPIEEPIKLSAWDPTNIAQHEDNVKNTVRKDGILAASGVSLLYVLSPYMRSLLPTNLANHSKQTISTGNIFVMAKNTYTFAHGFLPQSGMFRRIGLVGGLVLILPTLLPPKTLPPAVVDANSFINTDIYEPLSKIRGFITYPLLEIFLFHKILFLRVLPILGPVGAHALTAVAYTLASAAHSETMQPVQMMAQCNDSIIMQLSFYLSGGRVLYPLIFRTVQNTKDVVFQSFTSFSIFEHAHVYRAMIDNAVSENLRVYGVAHKDSKGLDIFVVPPPQSSQGRESSTNRAMSLAATNEVVADIASRALTHFSSSDTPHLSLLDAVDFIFAFRTAVGMTCSHRQQPPLVSISPQKEMRDAGSSSGDSRSGSDVSPTRESVFTALPVHLIPTFCTDMAHVQVMKQYPHGMRLEDIKDFISAECVYNESRSLTDEEMLQAESRMYEVWSNEPLVAPLDSTADESSPSSSSELTELIEEMYRSLFLAQLQTCSVLAARYFQRPPLQALSAKDLRLLEGEEEGREKGSPTSPSTISSYSLTSTSGDKSRVDRGRGGDLLAALCPEEVETSFGPSHTRSYFNSEQCVLKEEGAVEGPWQQLALEVQHAKEEVQGALKGQVQRQGQGDEDEDVGEKEWGMYNPLNCILSTVSRREAITVLYPYGLTIRRFQLLLDRAESRGDKGVTESRQRLRSELHSEEYKDTLRREMLKNVERGI